jgi:hypothetical protein
MNPYPHPEDVKASIRKRFGTLRAFERAKGLPDKSVSRFLRGQFLRGQFLRGHKSGRVRKAILEVINAAPAGSSRGEGSRRSTPGRENHAVKVSA